jgi:fructose-1,6-bisphosphatase/inositol monophosphatase family enzyme
VSGALDAAALLGSVRRLHETIRAGVSRCLADARRAGDPTLANQPGAWGAGDISYAIDTPAEAAVEAFGEDIARTHPVTIVCEGPGVVEHRGAGSGPALRAIIDPVDGTRSLMHDMRSAWALTGIARDRGEATRLSDIEVAVQTELPTTTAAVYHVMTAVRGQGARIARHDVTTGGVIEEGPLIAPRELPLDNGYLVFTRYLAVERPIVADLERRFLDSALAAHGIDPRLIYDDQYLCSAGQLFLVTTGRYRMLADLRGWLRETRGLANFTAKPYDLAALLIYREAGVPVLDAAGDPLDAPLDTETPLSVLAWPNDTLRAAYQPHLRAAMDALS